MSPAAHSPLTRHFFILSPLPSIRSLSLSQYSALSRALLLAFHHLLIDPWTQLGARTCGGTALAQRRRGAEAARRARGGSTGAARPVNYDDAVHVSATASEGMQNGISSLARNGTGVRQTQGPSPSWLLHGGGAAGEAAPRAVAGAQRVGARACGSAARLGAAAARPPARRRAGGTTGTTRDCGSTGTGTGSSCASTSAGLGGSGGGSEELLPAIFFKKIYSISRGGRRHAPP